MFYEKQIFLFGNAGLFSGCPYSVLFKYGDSYMEIQVPADEEGYQLSIPGMKMGGHGTSFIRDKGFVPINGLGSQIYFGGPNPKSIDTTIGPEYSFHFSNGTFNEMQNEEPKPKETIAEPEEAIIPADE